MCRPDGAGCTKAGTYPNLHAPVSPDYTGFAVTWTAAVVRPYSSGVPLWWTAYITYTNVSSGTLVLGCPGNWTNPSNVWERMSGGSGDDGGVPASATTCSDNPGMAQAIPPGGSFTATATFHNVPWPGSRVAIAWGDAGTSAAVNPFAAPSLFPPCTINPLYQCQSLDSKVALNIDYWGNTSACTFRWNVDWGDGSSDSNLVVADPPDGDVLLISHTYRNAGRYPISVTGSASGNCTVSPFTATFTQLAYAALGDSYAAGVGAAAPLPGFENPPGCHRSGNAYPELVGEKLGYSPRRLVEPLLFVACNGARIRDFDKSQAGGIPPQLAVLKDAVDTYSVGLVTLTISGNDADFATVMRYCARRDKHDEYCRVKFGTTVAKDLARIKTKLPGLFSEVKKTRRLNAYAKVAVVDYPLFFPPGQASPCGTGVLGYTFAPTDMAWIDKSITALDGEITRAARAAGLTPVDIERAFRGHYLCQSRPYLHAAVLLPPSDLYTSYHPTAAGYRVIAGAVERALRIG